jgi:hypothetical protein
VLLVTLITIAGRKAEGKTERQKKGNNQEIKRESK